MLKIILLIISRYISTYNLLYAIIVYNLNIGENMIIFDYSKFDKAKITDGSGGFATKLSEATTGLLRLAGDDNYCLSLVEEIGKKENILFGISWEEANRAYEAAGFKETDETPMMESDWNYAFEEQFKDYIKKALASSN